MTTNDHRHYWLTLRDKRLQRIDELKRELEPLPALHHELKRLQGLVPLLQTLEREQQTIEDALAIVEAESVDESFRAEMPTPEPDDDDPMANPMVSNKGLMVIALRTSEHPLTTTQIRDYLRERGIETSPASVNTALNRLANQPGSEVVKVATYTFAWKEPTE